MDDQDVLKELETKNQEMYLNNLNNNLSLNLETILLGLNEKIKVQSMDLRSKVSSILENNELGMNDFELFTNNLFLKLKDLLMKRYNIIKEYISDINNQKYEELLSSEGNNLINDFKNYYGKMSLSLIETLLKDVDDFKKNRLVTYINDIFLEKIIDIVQGFINDGDRILCNNYQIDYNRFQKINKNTIKKV